jgi:hypothetical protein
LFKQIAEVRGSLPRDLNSFDLAVEMRVTPKLDGNHAVQRPPLTTPFVV